MLLGHLLLTNSRETAAADIWRIRERTEHEASALFFRLAEDLREAGAPHALVALATRCSDDETEHAAHCRAIVHALAPGLPALPPELSLRLGRETTPARRALYTSVALGCVTESLSTALLIEMRPHAGLPVVRAGLDRILSDEVRHSRLGWAYLAFEADRGDVSWLTPHVTGMLRAALDTEVLPTSAGPSFDLREFGILGVDEVRAICAATVTGTIAPGLEMFGITPAFDGAR